MSWKLNPFTGNFDYYENNFKGVTGTAPSNPQEGWLYLNNTNHTLYIYYGGSWQVLHVLNPGSYNYLLLETGDILLLETGDKLALED